jgi:hypothetical protein
MAVIVEGLYKDGKIELLETPANLPEGRVRVIVIAQGERAKPGPRMLTFGCLATGDTSTLDDFEYPDAQWQKEWHDTDAPGICG